jgi:hypothetical protein
MYCVNTVHHTWTNMKPIASYWLSMKLWIRYVVLTNAKKFKKLNKKKVCLKWVKVDFNKVYNLLTLFRIWFYLHVCVNYVYINCHVHVVKLLSLTATYTLNNILSNRLFAAVTEHCAFPVLSFPPTNEDQVKEDRLEKNVPDVTSRVDRHGRWDQMEFPAPS